MAHTRSGNTRYPKRQRNPVDKLQPEEPKPSNRKRKAGTLSAASKKKARKAAESTPAQITGGYAQLVFAAIASSGKTGASYPTIHSHVQAVKENANRKLVTKAVAALLDKGYVEPSKKHQRKFVAVVKAAAKKKKKAAPAKKKAAPAKKKTKKKKASKKAAPAKKKTKKKTTKKAAPKKKTAGVKVIGYQKFALDAIASAPRGGLSHTQIHAAVRSANSNANKTYITKAVRALQNLGLITATKRHSRKFVCSKK